ncbi:UNVERIFIED_CONTAM: LamG domain-containing protein, partial [Bacteroidetes bacterium 56_B9]
LTSDYPKISDASITSKLYIDGEYVGIATEYCNPYSQGNSSQADYGYGVKFQLGGTMKRNSTTTLNALSMSIDNLRVYDTRVLSASEVKEIYEA